MPPAYIKWASDRGPLGYSNTARMEVLPSAGADKLADIDGVTYRNGSAFLPIRTPDQARAAVEAIHTLLL
jgi:hypothetical protein